MTIPDVFVLGSLESWVVGGVGLRGALWLVYSLALVVLGKIFYERHMSLSNNFLITVWGGRFSRLMQLFMELKVTPVTPVVL